MWVLVRQASYFGSGILKTNSPREKVKVETEGQ